MSKTIETQIEKSRSLIEGLRANMSSLPEREINANVLDSMAEELHRLDEANKECDELRALLPEKVRNMNSILIGVKDIYAEKKRIVKGMFPQTEWLRFGVADKR
ncbi:MAG: hypothetical protein PUG21_00110 [Prevotella sp.]|nr:hypothetical protein [Prevotella sp.]